MSMKTHDFSFETRYTTPYIDAFIVDDLSLLNPQKIGGDKLNSPVILSVPHGGRFYPSDMIQDADLNAMRTLEDVGSDIIVMPLINAEQSAVIAKCSRAIIDVNRPQSAIDPKLIKVLKKQLVTTATDRWQRYIDAGYGVVPRLSAKRQSLYKNPPSENSIHSRIDNWHHPYHALISEAMNDAQKIADKTLLLDIHSMPNSSPELADIVIGNLNGTSASAEFSELIIKQIKKFDLSYSVNAPYSGGFITEHHGNPALNKHAIQIEINRDLYLREDFKISTEAVRELGVVLGDVIQSVSSLC